MPIGWIKADGPVRWRRGLLRVSTVCAMYLCCNALAAPVWCMEPAVPGGEVAAGALADTRDGPDAPDAYEVRVAGSVLARIEALAEASGTILHRPLPQASATRRRAAESVDLIHAMYASPNPAARLRAVELNGRGRQVRAPGVALAALSDPEPAVRTAAAQAVGEEEPSRLAGWVLLALEKPGGEQSMAQVLPVLGRDLAPPLIAVLEDTEAPMEQRQGAAQALGLLGAPAAADVLETHLKDTEHLHFALACGRALLSLQVNHTASLWLSQLEHADPRMQSLAVEALGVLGGVRAMEALLDIAKGNGRHGPWLQQRALGYIGAQPREEAIPALVAVMEANRSLARKAAARLEAMTGLSFGADPETWRKWMADPVAFMRAIQGPAQNDDGTSQGE